MTLLPTSRNFSGISQKVSVKPERSRKWFALTNFFHKSRITVELVPYLVEFSLVQPENYLGVGNTEESPGNEKTRLKRRVSPLSKVWKLFQREISSYGFKAMLPNTWGTRHRADNLCTILETNTIYLLKNFSSYNSQ
jgi:hypothetical protein